MLLEIDVPKECKLVLSHSECGYQEVLDDFPNATSVQIITYNVDDDTELKDALSSLGDDVDVLAISNIPNRYPKYYNDYAKNKASKTIKKYFSILDPNAHDSKFKTKFNLENHAKVIMTNNIVYIGSANFSGTSRNNFEIGVIIKDKAVIDQIRKEFIPVIDNSSYRYYGTKISIMKTRIAILSKQLEIAFEALHQQVMKVSDDFRGETEYYSPDLTEHMIDCIRELCNEVEIINDEISDESVDFDDLREQIDIKLINLINRLIIPNGSIDDLITFDFESHATNYAIQFPDAYDENLEHYIQLGMEKAFEIQEDLENKAKDDLLNLLTNLPLFIKNLNSIRDELERMESVATKINNT